MTAGTQSCQISTKGFALNPWQTYLGHSFIPTTDHFLLANLEFEGLASVPGGIKLASVCQRPCQKDLNKFPPQINVLQS